MDRRTFLKMAGIGSLSVAVGCTGNEDKHLYSLVHAPDNMVTGKPSWYASTCRECPAGCGVIAKNREGRVIKVEGNPLHPVNQGKLCMRGQAALQGIYSPDRIRTPLINTDGGWQPISWKEAEKLVRERLSGAVSAGGQNVFLLSEVVGDTTLAAMNRFLSAMNAGPPVLFEPFAYEALKAANAMTFGLNGLCGYRIDEADVLVGFGADFLETWLSPVEYARKFKMMHGYRDGRKGLFIHVGPYLSVTAANADQWIPAACGAGAAVALGCVREALAAGKGDRLPPDIRKAIDRASAPFTVEAVCVTAGVDPEAYRMMVERLLGAERPLVLGQGVGAGSREGLETNLAVNLLNLVLDPDLSRFDFSRRPRVEIASGRAEVYGLFNALAKRESAVVLLNNVNPVFSLPASAGVREVLARPSLFVVSVSNFMDDTSALADLILPVRLPLERWGEYAGLRGVASTLQPAMGKLTDSPDLCDLLTRIETSGSRPASLSRKETFERLRESGTVDGDLDWVEVVRRGGIFDSTPEEPPFTWKFSFEAVKRLAKLDFGPEKQDGALQFIAAPSLRFFDGRGGNKSWLAEHPDPVTMVAWQTPVWIHPDTMAGKGIPAGELVDIESAWGKVTAPAYPYDGIRPDVVVMTTGQGHEAFGRYAKGNGANPFRLLPAETDPVSGGPAFRADGVAVAALGKRTVLANTDGSKFQHGRKIALTVGLNDLHGKADHGRHAAGFAMHDFPMNLPLPEGYDPHLDVYPPHEHRDDYRWGMVVDLDRCIGCGACSVACYAENNIGVVGEKRIVEGREMSWIRIERYHDPQHMEKVIFLPMMCQHCDNAPCESVCPVYAPHHGHEGLNNQIYNRCIGTRYCSQNCPYKVRRFNWFEWDRPRPLHLQLNPDVTVRMRGVMEKCSFCVQRIKEAHGWAKNENRRIRDGEMVPACVQTCPTDALVFGNLADKESRVRKMTDDPRAYQVMGYLNTKPAVIYLKKVVQEI
ncbi:molybdopterin dinucleotide binding domain-containing protein [Desulfococcus sp.]|uniref:molybdopterin dinucleotide binding domain-containing protein n=1 Tax=Desulfococcus sp. TaxID=2025834 RepID=UPI0035942BDB